jgi:hypothetical protein
VSEPAADHIHLDAGFDQMDGGRVPEHVRRDQRGVSPSPVEQRGDCPRRSEDVEREQSQATFSRLRGAFRMKRT